MKSGLGFGLEATVKVAIRESDVGGLPFVSFRAVDSQDLVAAFDAETAFLEYPFPVGADESQVGSLNGKSQIFCFARFQGYPVEGAEPAVVRRNAGNQVAGEKQDGVVSGAVTCIRYIYREDQVVASLELRLSIISK